MVIDQEMMVAPAFPDLYPEAVQVFSSFHQVEAFLYQSDLWPSVLSLLYVHHTASSFSSDNLRRETHGQLIA